MARYGFDIETNGLLEQLDTIHSLVLIDYDTREKISCADQPGYTSIKEGVSLLQEADEIFGHNIIKFDIPGIQKVYPEFKPKGYIYDTLNAARLIWPKEILKDKDFKIRNRKKNPVNMPGHKIGTYGLEAFGYRLGLHKGDYSKEMKEKGLDPWASWNQSMQDYCEQDVVVTIRLRETLDAYKFSEEALELEMDVQKILFRQEEYGFLFDEKAAGELYSVLIGRKEELSNKLQEAFKPWMRKGKEFTPKRKNKKMGYQEGVPFTKVDLTIFNPGSRQHIADRLKALRGWKPSEFTPDGRPKVDEEILEKLPYPEAELLCEYLMVDKRLGAIAEGKQSWLKAIKADGRIHGTVTTNGAVTGRMTHQRPNMAQVPSSVAPYGKECRALFIVPKGKKLVGCDASSLELCNLAGYMHKFDDGAYVRTVLEGDKAQGTDIHSVNARALGMDPKKTYEIRGKNMTGRDVAKTWFYAFIYGGGNKRLGWILGYKTEADQAKHGKKSRTKFMKSLPALKKLSEKVAHKVETKGYLLGLDGRKLHVRSAHSALNTLLQSAGAIIMKKALVILDKDLQAKGYVPGRDYEFVANVHDEFQIEVTEEYAEDVGKTAQESITKAGQHYNFKCPLYGDYAIGGNWAATH